MAWVYDESRATNLPESKRSLQRLGIQHHGIALYEKAELAINPAVIPSVWIGFEGNMRCSHSRSSLSTLSALRFPGIMPEFTVWHKPIICQAAEPPFEWPVRLF